MKTRYKIAIVALIFAAILAAVLFAMNGTIQLLEPRGEIAGHQLSLMISAVLLMLIVMVPVFALAAFFAYWYRASNEKAYYTPNWEHGVLSELVWWAIPLEIILVLGALTWTSTHELDPMRPLPYENPLTVQVVALNWKWLFIYPEQNIATVSELRIPIDTPIEFEITADQTAMNAFWIPRLGGMIYAMTGMSTSLHLIAEKKGVYNGLSANYSGDGFADMKFLTHAVSKEEFEEWITSVRTSPSDLTKVSYEHLAKSGVQKAPLYYASVEPDLYDTIVQKYMNAPAEEHVEH